MNVIIGCNTEPENQSPKASFTYQATGREVQFTDHSTDADGTINVWQWDFGDDSTSILQNPNHRYAIGGTYTVNLIVTDNDGKKNSTSQSISLKMNSLPSVSFSYTITGSEVAFTNTSTDSDGVLTSWFWKFGDDSISTFRNPIHRYEVAGNYDVCLIATDNEAAKDSMKATLTLSFPYQVYNDVEIPASSVVWTWSGAEWGGPPSTFNGNFTGESPPEGTKCFKVMSGSNWGNSTNYAGWGVFLAQPFVHNVNLSSYTHLKFWVKTSINLKLEVQQYNRYGQKFRGYISDYGWDSTDTWQEISIPDSEFSNINIQNIFCPFMITVEQGNKTFYIDNVRWTN
jgi:PKD repeat protein